LSAKLYNILAGFIRFLPLGKISPSTQRMEIYRALGIPEVWRYTKQRGLVIYQLKSEAYEESSISLAFPQIKVNQLNEWLVQRQTQGENQVIQSVRRSVQR
jgi:hypothetical protein